MNQTKQNYKLKVYCRNCGFKQEKEMPFYETHLWFSFILIGYTLYRVFEGIRKY